MADQVKTPWEFTDGGAKFGETEFKLRSATTGKVLLKYAERVRQDSEIYKTLLSAVGSLAAGEGPYEDLLSRVRETVKARDAAAMELEGLDRAFEQFFETPGILSFLKDKRLASQFSQELVLRFASRG